MGGVRQKKVETNRTCHVEQTHPSDADRESFVAAHFGSCEAPDISNFNGDFTTWPLFSLQPAIHRAQHIVRSGGFDPAPSWTGFWRGIFELKFAVQWYCQGGKRAKLCEPAAVQIEGHVACNNQ